MNHVRIGAYDGLYGTLWRMWIRESRLKRKLKENKFKQEYNFMHADDDNLPSIKEFEKLKSVQLSSPQSTNGSIKILFFL